MIPVHIVITLFLIATLVIGLWRFRHVDSFEKYAFGDGKMHTGILAISFIATFVGAGDLVAPSYVYQYGIVNQLEVLGYCFVFLFFIFFLSKKLEKQHGVRTISDLMKKSYGQSIGLLTSFIGICTSIIIAGLQLNYFREIGSSLLGIESGLYFTLGVGLLLTIYMATGGMRAIALTDLLQLSLVVVVVAYLAQAGVARIFEITEKKGTTDEGTFFSFYEKIKSKYPEKLSFWTHPKLGRQIKASTFWGFFPAFLLAPPLMQRMLMSRPKKIRSVFWSGFFFYPLFRFFLVIIGLSALILMPGLEEREALTLTDFSITLFGKESWITGLTMVGTIALALSTADSFLHSAVVLAMKDLVKPYLLGKKASQKRTLQTTRIIAIAFAWLALMFGGGVSKVLFYSISLLSLITIPLLVAIAGWRVSARSVWASIGAGALTFMLLYQFGTSYFVGDDLEYSYTCWIIAIIVNGLTFWLVNAIWPEKKKPVTNKTVTWEAKERPWGHKVMRWLEGLRTPIQTAQRKVKQHGSFPFIFSWFIFILYMVPTWDVNHGIIDIVHVVGVALCLGLLARSKWPRAWEKRYFSLYYLVTILYCLPFASTVLFLTQPSNAMAQTLVFLSVLLLMILVDWQSFCLFTALGAVGGMMVHYAYTGHVIPTLSAAIWWNNLVGLFFTIFIGMLFIRRERWIKEVKHQALIQKTSHQASDLQVVNSTQEQVLSLLSPKSSVFSEMYAHLDTLRTQGSNQEILERMAHGLQHLEGIKREHGAYLPLKPEKVFFKTLFNNVASHFSSIEFTEMPRLTNKLSAPYCIGDKVYLTRMVLNALNYLQSKSPDSTSHVYWVDSKLAYSHGNPVAGYRLLVSNQPIHDWPDTKKIGLLVEKQEEFPAILEKNRQIVHAHFGTIDLVERDGLIMQSYVLPYDLHSIRPKIGSLTDEYYLSATQLDSTEDLAFLALTKEKGLAMPLIRKALLDCKHYHRKQRRKSGEAYYLHPLRVASMLLNHTSDLDIIVAGLLHDTVEDTPYTLPQIKMRYGSRVGELVAGVTNLYGSATRKIKLEKKEKFKSMLAQEDKGPMMVKLFDRLDNIRTIAGHPSQAKRRAIAKETIAFFLPIAQVLGLTAVAEEMESLVQEYLS